MPGSSTPLPTDLGGPATRGLTDAGFRTLDDLTGISERVLLALHGVGPKAIKTLRERGANLAP